MTRTHADLGVGLIPKERYTSADFARVEWERMWTKVWLLAGRESDISSPGDYLTFEIGPESIVVVRQTDGTIRAHANVCMHRGNRLCAPGNGHVPQRFTCGFHGWQYGLDGRLLRATDPDTFPQGLPLDHLSLRGVRCDTWGGFVWINFHPAPEPLAEFLGPVAARLLPYKLEKYALVQDQTARPFVGAVVLQCGRPTVQKGPCLETSSSHHSLRFGKPCERAARRGPDLRRPCGPRRARDRH